MAEIKILMVCLGNICRSPVAEGLLKHIAQERGMKIHVDSAGTSGHHAGEQPDRRSIANAKKNGVDISNQRSRKFTLQDFDRFDRIYTMDKSNYEDVIAMAKSEEHKRKVNLFLDVLFPGGGMEVPDPWYGGEKGFEEVFQLVKMAAEKLADELQSNK